MTEYTRKDLDREARTAAREIRQETGKAAKMVDWILVVHGDGNCCLKAIVQACDGLRQRHIAI